MPSQRLCLQLDAEVLLERLVLERLNATPKGRRTEWLRGLLVRGFLSENQVLREARSAQGAGESADEQTQPRHTSQRAVFGNWLARPTRPRATERAESVTSPPAPLSDALVQPDGESKNPADKPFAHLRKVIG